MQLDLFLDNRRTILVNRADEHLRKLELERAAALHDELLAGTPDDPAIFSTKEAINSWQSRLEQFHSSSPGIDRICHLHQNLTEPAPAALLEGLRDFLTGQLELEESPEMIFIPPRFHIGCLLLESGRPAEAKKWFTLALQSGIRERGRFLAYLGDSLAMASEPVAAREYYLAAFLEDPDGVDVANILDYDVRDMLIEMEEEGIDENETVCWMPVWGWLKGIFGFVESVSEPGQKTDFESLIEECTSGSMPVPRLWFECLRHAERLRTEFRDDKELLRVRKKMKELNPFTFGKYMEKIRR